MLKKRKCSDGGFLTVRPLYWEPLISQQRTRARGGERESERERERERRNKLVPGENNRRRLPFGSCLFSTQSYCT